MTIENNVEAVTIRPLRAEDGEIAGEIFFDAVHHGTGEHYTHEQRTAWAGASPNPSGWRNRLVDVDGFMAELNGTPAGFMTIDASGYIDLAFVRPGALGMGVGWLLYRAIEARAEQLGVACLTTEASRKARPFFERQGWTVEREQRVVKRGVSLTNFRMTKWLSSLKD
ncbi:GNAT family N-acetyltransferase [Iodidimonas sp. SYSU 1G8]|uniref:GNAT family N-acetyltransferase n=1 Tax=Iodidimonas sp. SYSU 1G8 TaxID=3133967 RepID=UPI0031FEDF8A